MLYYSTNNSVLDNEIYDIGPGKNGHSYCISFFGQSNYGRIEGNKCSGSADVGLRIFDGPFEVMKNIIIDNDGFDIYSYGHADNYGFSNACGSTILWNDDGEQGCTYMPSGDPSDIPEDIDAYQQYLGELKLANGRYYFTSDDGSFNSALIFSNQVDDINKYLNKKIVVTLKQATDNSIEICNIKVIDETLRRRLGGKLLLQVESRGRVWYVDKQKNTRYLIEQYKALPLFRELSLGITDADLSKIPVNTSTIDPNLDTDGDGYSDKHEIENGYNPYNPAPVKLQTDANLANRLKGQLLLQVEEGGRVWYVHEDGQAYRVEPKNILEIFRTLALGITNENLEKIPNNSLIK
jgi:hypothetical protein